MPKTFFTSRFCAANNNTGKIPDIFYDMLGSTLEVLIVAGKSAIL